MIIFHIVGLILAVYLIIKLKSLTRNLLQLLEPRLDMALTSKRDSHPSITRDWLVISDKTVNGHKSKSETGACITILIY